MSSFLIWPSHADVMRLSLPSASAIAVRAPTRLSPVRPRRQRLDRHVALCLQIRKLRRRERGQVREHVGFVGQRQMQRRGVRVLDDERVEIVQPLAEEHRDDVGLDDRRGRWPSRGP